MVALSLKEKRRFKPLNYISLVLVSIISALLSPRGEVIFKILSFPISRLSLETGLRTGLKLSLIMIISLTFSKAMFSGGIISDILNRFFTMESAFYSKKGSLKQKFLASLNESEKKEMNEKAIKVPYFTSSVMLCCFIILKVIDWKVL